jgi:hypothetical protein
MVITLDFLAEKFSRIGYFPGQYSMRITAVRWSNFGARQQDSFIGVEKVREVGKAGR